MSFETEFKELNKKYNMLFCKNIVPEASYCQTCKLNHTFSLEIVKKIMSENCLSRSRVRQGINNVFDVEDSGCPCNSELCPVCVVRGTLIVFHKALLKELGLGDEE